MLGHWAWHHHQELDGELILHGLRLRDLNVEEMLNFVYAFLVRDADAKGRRKIDMALEGRIGEKGGEIVVDADLPESMQGLEAPTWWSSDDDPMDNMQVINART